jgi:DNA-directed RNA polymerase subunit RPC12/RpoP
METVTAFCITCQREVFYSQNEHEESPVCPVCAGPLFPHPAPEDIGLESQSAGTEP